MPQTPGSLFGARGCQAAGPWGRALGGETATAELGGDFRRKPFVVHLYSGILFSLETEEILTHASAWVNPGGIMPSGSSQPQKDTHCPPHPRALESDSQGQK